MGLLDRLKLGGIALQVARYAGALLVKVGDRALSAILREVARLEEEEPNISGRDKLDILLRYVANDLRQETAVDLVASLVEWLVKWYKATGLFRSRLNAS